MKLLIIVLVLGVALVGVMYLFPQINFRKMPPGLIEGTLPNEKPNWVSSLVPHTNSHYIAPLHIGTIAQLVVCIGNKVPEVKIQKQNGSHLIAYRQSPIFHFVDWLCIHAN